MDYRDRIERRRREFERLRRYVIVSSVLVCLLWVPVAVILYRPSFPFFDTGPETSDEISRRRSLFFRSAPGDRKFLSLLYSSPAVSVQGIPSG